MKNTLITFVLLVTIQCLTVSCLNIAHADDNNVVNVPSGEQDLSIACANDDNGNMEAIQKNKFHNPDFWSRYEESLWGNACWNLSSLAGFPAIALLVVPGCELWGYIYNDNEDHFFMNPQKSYMVNPYTRYVSDKFIIEPIYCILSIPAITLKYLCDW